jgi:hypothetical protein
MLVRPVYVSYANAAMSDSDLDRILEKLQTNNKKIEVGGVRWCCE